MSVIINPGSGPVGGATREQADVCIAQFVADLGLEGVTSEYVKVCHSVQWKGRFPDGGFVKGPPDGRFQYLLRLGERECSVEMPGLPVEQVRYLGKPQNIWDFPRLYVNEGSWVWCFGVNIAVASLAGEDDEDE